MSETPESSQNLDIRCPSCRQRFSVGDELMDRMVECGGCDTRFRIGNDVIVRSKKFYPGERGGPDLAKFQRVPRTGNAPEGMQTVQYADFNHPEQLGPSSPQRIVAGVFGVCIMAVTALVLIFSTSPGTALDVMPITNKLIIAGFVSLLGIVLLVYANPSSRLKAIFFGVLFSAGLISIPFFFKSEIPVANEGEETAPADISPIFEEGAVDPVAALRQRFTTKPLEDEQERLVESGSERNAYGVYLTNLVLQNIYTAQDYLVRQTGAGLTSHRYPRDNGNYLVLLTDVAKSFDEVAEVAKKLGSVVELHPDIGIVVVKVDNKQFQAGSADKLNNKEDPAFYALNMHELQSIDLARVENAVKRLIDAPPKIFRTDITKILEDVMSRPGVDFHDDTARALLAWAEDPAPGAAASLNVLKDNKVKGRAIPEYVVKLIVKHKDPEAIPYIHEIWAANPSLWASEYVKMGSAIEDPILDTLADADGDVQRSALFLLAEVGTQKSLPMVRKLLGSNNPEVRVLAERAVAKISGR
ncbi:MAG: HEAT repeat domain-containing protein [Luteolibacter sp.]